MLTAENIGMYEDMMYEWGYDSSLENKQPAYIEDDKVLFLPNFMKETEKRKQLIKEYPNMSSVIKPNGLPKPSKAEPLRTVTEINQVKQWLLDKGNLREHALFILGITTGLRCGDLLSLKVNDILNTDRILLREQKTRKYNQPLITDEAQEALAMYLKKRVIKTGEEPLFKSRQGKNAVSIRQVNRVFGEIKQELGITYNFTSHSMRKTFAYHMLKIHEFDEEARYNLQSMLNHSDMRTTMMYAGLTADKQDSMRKALDLNLFKEVIEQ